MNIGLPAGNRTPEAQLIRLQLIVFLRIALRFNPKSLNRAFGHIALSVVGSKVSRQSFLCVASP